jgi:hypothetical protein
MENAKTEFLNHVGSTKVTWAEVFIEPSYQHTERKPIVAFLPKNYSDDQWNFFLNHIDVQYDSGYGTMYLWGRIMYDNGTWSDRGEYDGSEWWQLHELPIYDSRMCKHCNVKDTLILNCLCVSCLAIDPPVILQTDNDS